MPATNPIALPSIAFSKNLLLLVVQSDDYLAAAKVRSVNFLQFSAAVVADDEFVLSWNDGSASMTASDTPDNSGLQFPSGDGSDAYVTSLLPWFQGNYFLSSDYTITTDFGGPHPKLVFTALNYGPDYDFTGSGAFGNTTGGVTDVPKLNFQHHIELFIGLADRSGFVQAFDANIPLDYPVTGKTSPDIHEALHAYLVSDYPELVNPYAVCLNSLRPYFFKYGQFYGATPFVQKLTISDTYIVTKGGLSKQNALLRNIVTELCPGDDATVFHFLRQGSINKLIAPLQPEWVTWINFAAGSKTVSLEVDIFNDDASTFTFNAVAGLEVTGYQKTQFQCGFTQLDIAGRQELKNPIYYTVRIKEDEANYLTAAYAFVIDYIYRPWPRYFVYENSYGAFQTIGTVGRGLLEYDRTKDDAQYAVNQNQAAIDGEFLEVNILIQEKGTVSQGYDRSGKRNVALLRDFLLSRTKYVWDTNALVPIGINSKNLKDAADGVYVYANTFEYYPEYQEEVWTEAAGETDDSIIDLLGAAGTPITMVDLPPTGTGNVIVVEFGDTHLGTDGDHQSYTAAILNGLTNYRIYSTQLGVFFRTSDIQYNAGGFTVLVDGFVLIDGEQLSIFPYVLNPDE